MLEVLNLNENNCADCYKCIRTCSVKAITYANNTAEIVHDECILCGNCFVACPQKAKQVRNDVPRVKEAIAAGRHVVCSLAPSFIADFRIRSLDVMTDALKRLGFAEVQETAVGAQLVSDEYARIMREGKQRVLISSCCPSINMLIQKYYPTMLPHLAKVLTPMQAHCKAIKEQNPEAFTVFIGPCIAKRPRPTKAPIPISPSPTTSCATGWPPSISSCPPTMWSRATASARAFIPPPAACSRPPTRWRDTAASPSTAWTTVAPCLTSWKTASSATSLSR